MRFYDCAENVSRAGEILSLFVVRRPERNEKGDHAMHILGHIGVIDKAALIQVGGQARAYALHMLAQERAPELRLEAIGFGQEVEADDLTRNRLQLRLLGGVLAVARPDQEAQHERQKRRDEATT
ncbi:MAG: hypothetical protein WBQ45_25305 [Roseiarcus sp.]